VLPASLSSSGRLARRPVVRCTYVLTALKFCHTGSCAVWRRKEPQWSSRYIWLLGPFHGAIAVPCVTRCRCCCGHRCAGGVRQWRHLVNGNVKQAECGGSQWRMGPTFFKCFLFNEVVLCQSSCRSISLVARCSALQKYRYIHGYFV